MKSGWARSAGEIRSRVSSKTGAASFMESTVSHEIGCFVVSGSFAGLVPYARQPVAHHDPFIHRGFSTRRKLSAGQRAPPPFDRAEASSGGSLSKGLVPSPASHAHFAIVCGPFAGLDRPNSRSRLGHAAFEMPYLARFATVRYCRIGPRFFGVPNSGTFTSGSSSSRRNSFS